MPGITDSPAGMGTGWSRAAWFIGLWAASATATAIVAYGLRWLLLG